MNYKVRELKNIFQNNRCLWFKNVLLGAFLLVLFNIFFVAGQYIHHIGNQVQDKLGVYLYLNDIPGQEVQVYNKVLSIKKELEKYAIDIRFVSKDEAFRFLGKRLPNLQENFNKFNIENPLQSTLYLTFKDIDAYEHIKSVIEQNKDIIDNYKDIQKGTSLHSQNNRVLGIMYLSSFIKIVIYIMLGGLALLVILMLRHFLKVVGYHFLQDIYRKKIMGAGVSQIITPLQCYVVSSSIAVVILATIICLGCAGVLQYYIFTKLGVDVFDYLFSIYFLGVMVAETIVLGIIAIIVSYRYLYKIEKKLK